MVWRSWICGRPWNAPLTEQRSVHRAGSAALRYQVLRVRVPPDGADSADWRRTHVRLNDLRTRGICPVVGLMHHGIPPVLRSCSLRNAGGRALGLGRDWTPANEPLTMARFSPLQGHSALYGHWYPHHRDEESF